MPKDGTKEQPNQLENQRFIVQDISDTRRRRPVDRES